MDFVVPGRAGHLMLVEAKASRTVKPEMSAPLRRLAGALQARPGPERTLEMIVVHQPPRAGSASPALAPGVRALPWREFLETLARGR